MTIAAKHMDPVLGVDTHIILIPTPAGPVPTPLPHPHVGMVMDPIDYVPILGATVYINGMPRGQAGTAGIMTPPHIPMGGPFAKPPSMESEIFMGSATVVIDGEVQSFLGLPALSCQDIGMPGPPRAKGSPPKSLVLPTCVVLAVPMGPPVMIGGPPTISMMAMGMKLGMAALGKLFKKARALQKGSRKMKAISDKIHDAADKLMKKAGLGDAARNKVHKGICTVTGHPVDVATGKVFTEKTDVEINGPLPFKWERTWYSTSTYDGPLGHGWHHSYDSALLLDDEGIVVLYQTPDGRHVGLPALKEGQEHFDRTERITLMRDMGGYGIRDSAGMLQRFRQQRPGDTRMPLSALYDRSGNGIQLYYDERGRLERILDSGGRTIEIRHGRDGRISEIRTPHPDEEGETVAMARYEYDGRGNLSRLIDPLGFSESYEYDRHLLKKETDKNGLSFHFEWDAKDETAKCVRTWGDGGIYDHKLTYDSELNITTVENSLGHKTQYQHQGGLVIRTVDANGGTWLTEYSEHNQVLKETDPLGNATSHVYDERGNAAETHYPDGGRAVFVFDTQDNLLRATDAVGGTWEWHYDERGRLAERIDPLQRAVSFQYRGSQLIGVTDACGQTTALTYDSMGNIEAVHAPDGSRKSWQYDRLGRATTSKHELDAIQRREIDVTGRVLRVHEPDGNVRELKYDAEGNLIHVRDRHREVTLAYAGMGRLVARSEERATVRFQYDSEERLTAITNEDTRVYQFSLDATGEIDTETGFDGLKRVYRRDPLGRVEEVRRPGGLRTHYKYDSNGRVVRVDHSDGSSERYSYRLDGEMIEASNDSSTVSLERDALGRIVKEVQGQHWVSSTYDAFGMRSIMESSLGAHQEVSRNAMGAVTEVTARGGFSAVFQRDSLGQELSRTLPGGVSSRWQRDKLGRPVVHDVLGRERNHRTVRYEWDVDDRLTQIIDTNRGPTRFGHDPLGHLAWAEYPDGTRDVRMPNMVGDLFKVEDRSDRTYSPAGQLLESRDARGRITKYEYDPEGNLAKRMEPYGRVWRYHWNASGHLARVDRPDGRTVWFTYDALGRRTSKTFRGKTTRWVWDGNNPLHEWVEDGRPDHRAAAANEEHPPTSKLLVLHPPTGPPEADPLPFEAESDAYLVDAAGIESPTTWLFEPESFAPMAKLEGTTASAIICDHLGTPVAMTDRDGELIWEAQLDTFGNVRSMRAGERCDCPFRFPGQYEDAETGLYYNRFRYYDPAAGGYISQDPTGLAGGLRVAAYVADPATLYDPLGLNTCGPTDTFPVDPNDMTKKLGVPPSKAGKTPDGTTRVVWEPNPNTKIRYESHPHGLKPGDPGFNPRHHGEHYHVETKPPGMSWNQAKKKGKVQKAKPPGYTPGSGTGFVPGEAFPS